MTIAVERVGDEVEGGQGGELIKGARGDTADLVSKQAQTLQVVQALEDMDQFEVDFRNLQYIIP